MEQADGTRTEHAHGSLSWSHSKDGEPGSLNGHVFKELGTTGAFASFMHGRDGEVRHHDLDTDTNVVLPEGSSRHPLSSAYCIWFMHRSAGQKMDDYENATKLIATFASVEEFFVAYSRLQRPQEIEHVSDFHLFRKGVRPVWEDPANVRGGKWILRLRKGLASRYWQELLFASIGGEFEHAQDDVTGIVVSVRASEDILSVWNSTSSDGRVNLKIKETMKRCLHLPADVKLLYKSHDDSRMDSSHRTKFMNQPSNHSYERSYLHHGERSRGARRGRYNHRSDRYTPVTERPTERNEPVPVHTRHLAM